MSQGVFICFIYIAITLVEFDYPLPQRELVLLCPVLGPPVRSTCLRSANLYGCAVIETTIVSSSSVSQQFCIGVPLLRLQSYHHQYTSHNHRLVLRVQGLRLRVSDVLMI